MAENTLIEWATHTFNPWWGCMKVSPACDHCYAERDAKRFAAGRVLWGVSSERRVFGDKHWAGPINWNDAAEASAKKRAAYGLPEERPRVFCASMGDWLDLDGPIAEFVRLLDTIRRTPYLDWLLLTKRIGNFFKRLQDALTSTVTMAVDLVKWIRAWLDGQPPANVWLGATVVNQEEADRDIPKLMRVPAHVRFLSIEPMTEAVDLSPWLDIYQFDEGAPWSRRNVGVVSELDWVIAGGESGPEARPSHPDWFRSLRDQCAAAGVPFLFKQWGEWTPGENVERVRGTVDTAFLDDDGWSFYPLNLATDHGHIDDQPDLYRIGKKAAGRLLDGKLHDGYPGARA